MSELKGQIGLVHSGGFIGHAIQAFQSLEDDGDPTVPSRWNHALIAVSETKLVEAAPGGARERLIADYPDPILWSEFPLTVTEQDAIARWMERRIGAPYAYEDILLIAVALATDRDTPIWIERAISRDGRWICSAMVDAAFRAAGVHLFHDERPVAAVFPAAIARIFESYGFRP